MRKLAAIILFVLSASAYADVTETNFAFTHLNSQITGVLLAPTHFKPQGIVVMVHGSGGENAVAEKRYWDIRNTMAGAGYITFMWNGKSNQSIQATADEVIAAIKALKSSAITGSDSIGLWGISRAGWVNPLVISQYQDIDFWISASGVDDKENFNYLFAKNLAIEGYSNKQIGLLLNELKRSVKITHDGGSYTEYLAAIRHLSQNEFWRKFVGGSISKSQYLAYQQSLMQSHLDEQSGLQIYVDNFAEILNSINIPVLALFGEQDANVDWQKTRQLYQETMGKADNLTIASFARCNHNLQYSDTGYFYEFLDSTKKPTRCAGVLATIETWLATQHALKMYGSP